MTQVNQINKSLGQYRVIPVVSLPSFKQAEPLGNALVAGGLPLAEITFRTDAAEDSIRILAERGDLLVGAGTVLTTDQADRALQAGARFAVSPGFNPKVVRHCQDISLPIFPGISGPSDIEAALDHGLNTVKFFPAEAFGGVPTLKALSAPYPMINFIPTGGVNPKNLARYLELNCVLACGGSWMVAPKLLDEDGFQQVERAVRQTVVMTAT